MLLRASQPLLRSAGAARVASLRPPLAAAAPAAPAAASAVGRARHISARASGLVLEVQLDEVGVTEAQPSITLVGNTGGAAKRDVRSNEVCISIAYNKPGGARRCCVRNALCGLTPPVLRLAYSVGHYV